MRSFLKLLIWIILILPVALALGVFTLVFSDQPLLQTAVNTPNQQNAFTQILRQQQRELRFGNPIITISDSELNTLISHSLQQSRFRNRINADITLGENSGQLQLTADTQIPLNPFINVLVDFHIDGRQPVIDQARIGHLELPDALANLLLSMIGEGLYASRAGATWQRLFEAIKTIDISASQITLRYGVEAAKPPMLTDAQGNNLLLLYQAALLQAFPQGGKVPLTEAMQKLFSVATQRSANSNDAVRENTAVIITLGLQVAPENLLELFGIPERRNGTLAFSIERQRDLGKHFLTSAFLTIYGGKQLANLAGTYKELVDMQLRQDFNVRDLTANQAGIIFASNAINPAVAQSLQSLMANNRDEHFVLPVTKTFDADIKQQLNSVANNRQGDLLRTVRRKVGEFVEQAPLYQQLPAAAPN